MLAPVLNRLAARAVRPALQQTRGVAAYGDIVPGPPLHRISTAEKAVHAAFIFLGVMGYPFLAMFTVAGHKRAEFAEMDIPEKWVEWREAQKNKK